MTDFNTDTIVIPGENLPLLEKKVEQINKKAIKNGLVPMVLTVGEEIKTAINNFGVVSYSIDYPVSISGEWPAINGWKCIAKIDHRDGINIISIFGEIDVQKYRDRSPTCDHCGHNKIKVQSYLIQNEETGEIKQIGKSCIREYIQGDPKWMLQMLQWVSTVDELLEEEYSTGGGVEFYYSVEDVAQAAAYSINNRGFVRADDYDETNTSTPTIIDVNDYFFGQRNNDWASYWKGMKDDAESIKLAKGMIENFAGKTGDNNFVITIQQLLELGEIRPKFFSYIVGAMGGYFKHLAYEAKKAVDAKVLRVNGTVGEIKKRQDFNVILENVHTTCGYYGTIYIHKFRKDTGETIVWFANGTQLDAEVGDKMTIKATVKKYDKFKGWNQTIVTRVNVQ